MSCRKVEASAKSENSYKSCTEWNCGKSKRAKEIRAKILRKLKEEIRKAQALEGIVAWDFNGDVHS